MTTKKKKVAKIAHANEIANVTIVKILGEAGNVTLQVRVDIKSTSSLEFVSDLLDSYRGRPMVITHATTILQSNHISIKVFQLGENGSSGDEQKAVTEHLLMFEGSQERKAQSSQFRSVGISAGVGLSVLVLGVLALGIVFRTLPLKVDGYTGSV